MKKFLFLALVVSSLYGCESLRPTNMINSNKFIPTYNEQKLAQEDFFLNDSGVSYILDIIDTNVNANKMRTYENGDSFPVYLGEYLNIPCLEYGIESIDLVSGPEIKDYEAFIRNGRFYFRSRYQGRYIFNLQKNGVTLKNISINNQSKYKISEKELKNIVFENYSNKKLNELEKSVQLFKYIFPNSNDGCSLSMLLLDLASNEGNERIVKDESLFIFENYKLDEKEKMRVLSSQDKILGNDFSIPESELNFDNNSLEYNDFLIKNIIKKNNPTIKEVVFLESMYAVSPSQELADMISAFYYRLGDVKKGIYYGNSQNNELPRGLINSSLINKDSTKNTVSIFEKTGVYEEYKQAISYYKQKSYPEAILAFEKIYESNEDFQGKENIPFYLGDSYLKSNNLEKAKENLLQINPENNNYPEAMYRLGEIYYKLGEKDLAIGRFEKNKEEFSGTIWGRKSSIYLLKLK